MYPNRVNVAIDKIDTAAKHKTDEWSGEVPLQADGIVEQLKGGSANISGDVKDVIDKANRNVDICAEIEQEIRQQTTSHKRVGAHHTPPL